MTQYLLQIQNDEKWKQIKDQARLGHLTAGQGLLHKKPKRSKRCEPETRMEKFKKMNITIRQANGDAYPNLEDVNIWDTVLKCSKNGLDRLYDCAYDNFLRGTISPEEWSAVENLCEFRDYFTDPRRRNDEGDIRDGYSR